MTAPEKIVLPTRRLSDELVNLLKSLKEGDRIRVIQTVRVGRLKPWEAVATGAFRGINYLSTGISTDRVPEDDIVVPLVHFTKDNGELSTITLDENTRIERLDPPPASANAAAPSASTAASTTATPGK
jgi:hypothetical protein